MNKQISTGVGIAVVAAVGLAVAALVWFGQEPQAQTRVAQPIQNAQKESPKGVAENQSQPIDITNKIDFSKIQFDACGGKVKYEKMPWWDKFGAQVGKFKYYSNSFINSTLAYASENDYRNPKKIKYTYETYCKDKNFGDTEICGDGKDRNLSINDFSFGEYGEGCLSKDGTIFVSVFPGDYGGGGNYTFRYDIGNDTLEEAQKINENQTDGPWFAPPSAFGRRTGNIIKMSGGNGDAGCVVHGEFDYDIVKNQIKMTKTCTGCEGKKESCQTYK